MEREINYSPQCTMQIDATVAFSRFLRHNGQAPHAA